MKGLEGQTMWGKAYRGFGQGWFHATENAMCLLNIFWQVFNFVNAFAGLPGQKGRNGSLSKEVQFIVLFLP